MDQETVLRRILTQLARRDEQKIELSATQERVEADRENLYGILEPIFLAGVEEYNSQVGNTYFVFKDLFTVLMDLEKKTISAKVELVRKSGAFVDNELDVGDVQRISLSLAVFVDRLLKEKSIPFRFGEITVPENYYMH